MWHMHPRNARLRHRAAGTQMHSRPKPMSRRARRRPLPLHRIPQDHQRCPRRSSNHRKRNTPASGTAVGQRLIRLDGLRKVNGTEIFGADEIPANCLTVRAFAPLPPRQVPVRRSKNFRSHQSRNRSHLHRQRRPREDCYGVIPPFADQPIFAREDSEARYRGEAIATIVGETEAIEALDPKPSPSLGKNSHR